MHPELIYAILAVFSFTGAGFFMRSLTRVTSPLWTNAFKTALAAFAFVIAFAATGAPGIEAMKLSSLLLLMASGLIGLSAADWFLLNAYHRMGTARTIMVYRFQPLYLALIAFLTLGQTLNTRQSCAILLLISCILILSHEQKTKQGQWDFKGLLIALAGMVLDGSGIILTRLSFDLSPGLPSNLANLVRMATAGIAFALWAQVRPIGLLPRFLALSTQHQLVAVVGSLLGTFVGLSLWLKAVQLAPNVASIAAVGGLSPVIAVFIEAVLEKKWPSNHAVMALGVSLAGFILLL
jgi:drug/metabolite transporter (DMT)-like permease